MFTPASQQVALVLTPIQCFEFSKSVLANTNNVIIFHESNIRARDVNSKRICLFTFVMLLNIIIFIFLHQVANGNS